MEVANAATHRVLLLGPIQVIRGGADVPLPPSRKVRALLAYLAMAAHPVTRERLCELLWDVADDPRSELRWCLTKLRRIFDDPEKTRVIADRQGIGIATASLEIDALIVLEKMRTALTDGSPKELQTVRSLFRGEFLEGLSIDRAPLFDNWLAAERHRFTQFRVQLLERLGALLPPDSNDRLAALREHIEVAPFDENAHIELFRVLLGRRLYPEAERQKGASLKRFQIDGLDSTPLRAAFMAARRSAARLVDDGEPVTDAEPRASPDAAPAPMRGPALLVMPFIAATPECAADADSVTSDIIFGFAKLRSVSVIARGTAFSLRGQSASTAGSLANAQYLASGSLRREDRRYHVSVELSDPKTSRVFWAAEFGCDAVDSFSAPPILAAQIITGLDAEIHIVERNRALLTQPATLDAWQSYHLGLTQMYRFTHGGNLRAQQFFSKAIARDPTFSRSYAGLSFTHFQNAFLLHALEREREIAFAFEVAGQGLEADPSDPAVHCAMGRALWLRHEHESAVDALNRSVELSPNYALAHYALSFVHCQTGDPERAMEAAETANRLSPLDPMLFGMHGTRTFALVRMGRVQEAAEFARRAGHQPNAHVHAHAIATLTLAAAGRMEEARIERRRIKVLRPDYSFMDFEGAFHLMDDLRDFYRRAAKLVQIPN